MDRVEQARNRRNLEVARREFAAGRLSRRELLSWAAAWGLAGAGLPLLERPARAQGAKGPVNYLTWAGYQDTKLFAEFREKSGVTVNGIALGSNEQGFLKAKQDGGAALDVFTADAWWPMQNFEAGHIEPIAADALPAAKTLLPMFRDHPAFKLPDGKLVGFPYHWEYQTVVYRVDRVSPAPESLAAIFDPRFKGRAVWRNRGTEMINLMARVLGIVVDRPEHPRKWHLEPADLKRVTEELIKAKRQVQPLWYTSNAEAIKMFAADEVDVGFNSSYVAGEATKRGVRARALTKLKSGEQFPGYVDGVCLVKGAAHREAGLALMDWLTSFRGRQILFERDGYPSVDRAVIDWAMGAGFKDQMEARGVLDPAQMVPRLQFLAPPTDLQAWVDAFNTVRAA